MRYEHTIIGILCVAAVVCIVHAFSLVVWRESDTWPLASPTVPQSPSVGDQERSLDRLHDRLNSVGRSFDLDEQAYIITRDNSGLARALWISRMDAVEFTIPAGMWLLPRFSSARGPELHSVAVTNRDNGGGRIPGIACYQFEFLWVPQGSGVKDFANNAAKRGDAVEEVEIGANNAIVFRSGSEGSTSTGGISDIVLVSPANDTRLVRIHSTPAAGSTGSGCLHVSPRTVESSLTELIQTMTVIN